MASANVTLSNSGHEFEVDATQRTATLQTHGGWVTNTHATEAAYINTDGGAVVTTSPVGASCLKIGAGKSAALPRTCLAFTFKSAATTFLNFSKSAPSA